VIEEEPRESPPIVLAPVSPEERAVWVWAAVPEVEVAEPSSWIDPVTTE